MGESLTAKGHNGQINFDGKTVTIQREGLVARAAHGRNDKTLLLRHITAIQFKPVTFLSTGYIQFTVPGEISKNKPKGGRARATSKDENSVIFTKKQQAEFEALRIAIQTALAVL